MSRCGPVDPTMRRWSLAVKVTGNTRKSDGVAQHHRLRNRRLWSRLMLLQAPNDILWANLPNFSNKPSIASFAVSSLDSQMIGGT